MDHGHSTSRFQLSELRPLPEEIARMSEDETACQYCGISYLLLTKYEKMEQKMKETETELVKLKEYVEERPSLMAKIDQLAKARVIAEGDAQRFQDAVHHWQQQTHEATLKLEQANTRYTQLSKTLVNRQKEIQEKERREIESHRNSYAHQMIRMTHSSQYEVLQMRNDLSKLKGHVQSYLKISFPTMLKRISKELSESFTYQASQEREKERRIYDERYQGKMRSLEEQISCLNQSLDDANKQNERLSMELNASRDDFSNHITNQKSYIQGLQSANLALEERILESNRQVLDLSSEKESLHRKVQTLTDALEGFNQERSRELEGLERDNLDLKTQLSRAESTFKQQIHELKKSFEEKTTSLQNEQVSSDLKQAHMALAQKDKQMMQMENTIRELNTLLADMRLERVKTIEAHQSRIKQLQDKFLQDLKEAGNAQWTDREKELREKIEKEKDDLLITQREEMKKEVDDMKGKYEAQIQKLRMNMEDLVKSERRANQSQREMKLHIEHLSTNLDKLQFELEKSREQVASLSKDLAIARSLPKPGEEVESTLHHLRAMVNKKEAEIKFLKETVRLECEERMGLVASLAALKRDMALSQQQLQASTNPQQQEHQSQSNIKHTASLKCQNDDHTNTLSNPAVRRSQGQEGKQPKDSRKVSNAKDLPSSRPSSAVSFKSSSRLSGRGNRLSQGSLPVLVPSDATPETRFELLMQAANARKEKKLAKNRPIK